MQQFSLCKGYDKYSRWLKCILNREFHHETVMLLWDAILSNDLTESLEIVTGENIQLFSFNMLDFICVSMIIYLREDSKLDY